VRPRGRVVDTSAIRRYVAADSMTVSAALAGLEDRGFTAVVPDAPAIGGLARFLGTLGMAHACLLAAVLRVPLMTAEPALAGKILGADLIREV
jgi:hypothetical protein